MKVHRPFWPGLAAAALVLGLDQGTKWWILEVVMQPPRVIPLTAFFNLVLGWNRGVSFGLFNSDSALNLWLLPFVALAIVVALLIWLSRVDGLLLGYAIGMVIGGAIGNVVDRLFRDQRAVADFLDLHLAGYHWPAFNLADTGITVGAAILIIDSLFMKPEKPKNNRGKEKSDVR
ncbi:MAG: signal peptidase II [Rhodospirillales bacterium]|jgi:signal peptidase II|nr:signal peptidase II [Rhodospirillales bacterium]HIJ43203.1 signal peptidase II [Rhodospirillaceae bacterium]MDP7097313.1 signal peptidase II [Rhodospirillales bacterium]MDP7214352.1 signal peptidase II [Rhodospirillales bacterium]HIJ45457.1 signal peptidase II [Rhodospirillaceae bacterium]